MEQNKDISIYWDRNEMLLKTCVSDRPRLQLLDSKLTHVQIYIIFLYKARNTQKRHFLQFTIIVNNTDWSRINDEK